MFKKLFSTIGGATDTKKEPSSDSSIPRLEILKIIPQSDGEGSNKPAMPVLQSIVLFNNGTDSSGFIKSTSHTLSLLNQCQPLRPFKPAGGDGAFIINSGGFRLSLYYRDPKDGGQEPSSEDMVLFVEQLNRVGTVQAWSLKEVIYGGNAAFAMSVKLPCCGDVPCIIGRIFRANGNFETIARLSEAAHSVLKGALFFENNVRWTIANDDPRKLQLMETFWHLTDDKNHTCANNNAFSPAYRNG